MHLSSVTSRSFLIISCSLIIEFFPLSIAQDLSINPSYPSGDVEPVVPTYATNSTQIPSQQFSPNGFDGVSGLSPVPNLSRPPGNGGLSENKSFDGGNYDDDEDTVGHNRGMRSDKKKEKTRLALLKQIQNLDHMKCFPKVLCGLSVDSSQNSKDMDSYFVRSYIQLMRSATSDDGSSEEIKSSTSSDPRKDALSIFLMKSGLLKPKPKPKHRHSHSASSSEESDDEPLERSPKGSLLEKRNEALKRLLSKRKLANDKELISKHDDVPFGLRPILHLSQSSGQGEMGTKPLSFIQDDNENHGSVTSQIGSLVSSLVPWVNLSFGKDDSFEKDPFFKGGGKVNKKKVEEWEHNLDRLAMLMAAKDSEKRRKKKNKAKERFGIEGRSFRSGIDDEIKIYSTAVDIGKKLKDTKQCDYLYNGCPVTYDNIIKIIASIRKDIKESDESVESLSKEILQYSQQDTKQSSRKPVQGNKQPITQISHTLPNGEKVEINVQLSPKNENEEGVIEIESPHGDSDVPHDEVEENENADDDTAYHPVVDSVEVDAEGQDPAISASYELSPSREQLEDDHRRPSPSDIFMKLNRRRKSTTTTTTPAPPRTKPAPSPKYAVSKKRRPATSTVSPVRKPRPKPKPSPTPPRRRTPPTFATTERPAPTFRPTPSPTRQPTVKPRSPTRHSPVLKSGKVTTTKPKLKIKKHSTPPPSIEESSEDDSSPMWSKIAASSGTVSSLTSKKKGSPATSGGTIKKTSIKRTTGRPTSHYEDDDVHVPSKITIEIDKSTEKEDETNSNEEIVTSPLILTTTTRKPLRPRPTTSRHTTTARTTTTTTPSPLSLLTQSYYDQVVADMFKTTRSPTRKTTTHPPTTPPSKRRRKPINYNKNSQYPHHNGPGFIGFKSNSTTIDETYAMSVESGSGEVRPFHMADIGNPNPWTEIASTSPKPPSHDMDDPTELGSGGSGKKRITYKNGKRPYLVLMKPWTGVKLKSPGQLSPGAVDADYSSQPLVIEPGTSDHSHWSPNN